jgi:hypothetical protein
MQPDRVAAFAEVGGGREAAVSSAQNRNRFHRHVCSARWKIQRAIMMTVGWMSTKPTA